MLEGGLDDAVVRDMLRNRPTGDALVFPPRRGLPDWLLAQPFLATKPICVLLMFEIFKDVELAICHRKTSPFAFYTIDLA